MILQQIVFLGQITLLFGRSDSNKERCTNPLVELDNCLTNTTRCSVNQNSFVISSGIFWTAELFARTKVVRLGREPPSLSGYANCSPHAREQSKRQSSVYLIWKDTWAVQMTGHQYRSHFGSEVMSKKEGAQLYIKDSQNLKQRF